MMQGNVGNVSRETLVKICVDDTARSGLILPLWRYGRCYRVGCLICGYGLWWRVMYERSGIFHVKHWYDFTLIDE